MKKFRCFLFAALVLISSATFALGGVIQFPGKSDPPPPPPASATDGMTSPSTEAIQIAWQDVAMATLRDLLLTIY